MNIFLLTSSGEKYLLKRKTGRPYKKLRTTVNAIYWIMKTGSMWKTLPERFGKWKAVQQCFSLWSEEGIFENIFMR